MEIKNLIGGLLAGAAIGLAVGILVAPGSGLQTRKKITKKSKRFAAEIKNTVANAIEESIESLKEKFNAAVDDSAKRGRTAISNASERVKVN